MKPVFLQIIKCVLVILAPCLIQSPLLAQPKESLPFSVSENYLTRHDIVFLSPTQLEAEGFPMGNGNMGGMIWNHDNGIEIQINKNDLWTTPNPVEGNTSILKHAARIKVDFGFPVFSWIHLKDFEGRLSLQNGEATYSANTGYSSTKIKTWPAYGSNVWVIECENVPNAAFIQGRPIARISLERMGSRAFASWYSGRFPKDASIGIGDTRSSVKGKDILIEEKGDGLDFAIACRVIGGHSPTVINSHKAELAVKNNSFTILISLVTKKDNEHPGKAAIVLLNQAEQKTIQQLKKEKDEWYQKFWSKSFVKIGNDYLENIYYLRRYLMAAGSQGKYPVCFNGGLWRWNRDVLNWVTPHHWNTQQQYWGLCAQNDVELMKPYVNTYFNIIPSAEALAKERGAPNDALLITEAHDFDGQQCSKDWKDMEKNFTPASQIATLFWDYYDFSGNQKFLQDTAYVFMKKAANFYLNKLRWNAEKNEYFLLASLYESESIREVKNPASDRACIESLFKNCIKAAKILAIDKDKIEMWQHILNHLWKIRTEPYEKYGPLIVPADEYFSEHRYTPFSWACGGAIVFPSGLIGIQEKETELGQAVVNLVKSKDNANAHYPLPIIAARMGLGDQALTYLLNGVKIHQIYPQGLMHNVTGYPDNIYNLHSIHDLLNGKYKVRSQAFFQCGMEPISNYATTINEMLLQSNEGMIRVFPAIPKEWDQAIGFKLLARGGFLVSSTRDSTGQIPQINIHSVKGNLCRIKNPWPGKNVLVIAAKDKKMLIIETKNKKISMKPEGDDIFSFKTKAGTDYFILQKDGKMIDTPLIFSSTKNSQPKRLGNRILGKESGWNTD